MSTHAIYSSQQGCWNSHASHHMPWPPSPRAEHKLHLEQVRPRPGRVLLGWGRVSRTLSQAGDTTLAGDNEHMDLIASARAVCPLSTSVQSLQVAGFGFPLLMGELHTPFLLLFPGPSNCKAFCSPSCRSVYTGKRRDLAPSGLARPSFSTPFLPKPHPVGALLVL